MKEEKYKRLLYLAPIFFITLFLPFIVFIKQVNLQGIIFSAWTGDKVVYDLFSYYRSIVIILVALISFLIFSLNAIENKSSIEKKIISSKKMFFLLVYLVLVIISTMSSIFIDIAIFGFVERNEGLLSIASYLVFFISIYLILESEVQLEVLFWTLVISSSFLSIIGLLQYFGLSIFPVLIENGYLLPAELFDYRYNLIVPEIKHTIIMTFGNSNYVGSYVAILFPISLGLFLTSKSKKITVILGLHSCLIFSNWIGCRSRAGMVAAIVAIIVMIILLRNEVSDKQKKCFIVIPYIIIFLIMNDFSGGSLLSKVSTLSPEIEQGLTESRYLPIKDMIFTRNSVKLITEESTLEISLEDQNLNFYDKSNTKLEYELKEDKYVFLDQRYSDYSFELQTNEGMKLLYLQLRGMKINYFSDDSGIYLIGNHNKLYNEINKAPFIGFEGRERFGSGRGYIWSRTLPLIKDTIWLGNGPDTFTFYFPQYDNLGKLNSFGKAGIIVDKPHNYYLQVAHDSGVISLITLLLFFASYFIQSLRLYMFNKSGSFVVNVGKILMCSVLGYLVAAIFNDSVVYVAPYFWILLGTGFAVNYMVKYPEMLSTKSE